jgi:hypothetical protein
MDTLHGLTDEPLVDSPRAARERRPCKAGPGPGERQGPATGALIYPKTCLCRVGLAVGKQTQARGTSFYSVLLSFVYSLSRCIMIKVKQCTYVCVYMHACVYVCVYMSGYLGT